MTFPAVNYTSRWSYDGFPLTRKHDGVYVRVEAPNASLGSDIVRIAIEPTGPATTATGQVGRIRDADTLQVGSLEKTMGVRVELKLGALTPALSLVAGENVTITRGTEGTTPTLTFQATPTQIPLVSNTNVCKTPDGKANALVNQLYMYIVWANGTTPFGVGGLSGNMTITSNGFCGLSTPVWNQTDKTFNFTASAPHLAPDGSAVNTGFYRAVIPAADAKLLFDIESADIVPSGVSSQSRFSASTALEVEISETDGVQKTFTKNIGFDGSNFVVSALNFRYSTNKIRMKKGALTPVTGNTAAPTSGTPTNTAVLKIAAPRVSAPKALRGIASVTLTAATGVSYKATAKLGKKSVSFKCSKKARKVTCVSKKKLTKGTWSIVVTPSKGGQNGNTATKKIRIRQRFQQLLIS
jgi:hypothetical protein